MPFVCFFIAVVWGVCRFRTCKVGRPTGAEHSILPEGFLCARFGGWVWRKGGANLGGLWKTLSSVAGTLIARRAGKCLRRSFLCFFISPKILTLFPCTFFAPLGLLSSDRTSRSTAWCTNSYSRLLSPSHIRIFSLWSFSAVANSTLTLFETLSKTRRLKMSLKSINSTVFSLNTIKYCIARMLVHWWNPGNSVLS